MTASAEQMKARTQDFALAVIRFVESLADRGAAGTMGRQLLRSGTSVGANYRASCRAKSRADFAAKMGIVLEEADETVYWLELLVRAGTAQERDVSPLLKEANEIVAIAVSSLKTVKSRSVR